MTDARRLVADDLPAVVDVVVAAFLDYPYWRWLVDDVVEREATMRAYYACDLPPLLADSWAVDDGDGGLAAVAIWFRSDGGSAFEAGSTPAAGAAAGRMAVAIDVMAAMTPPEPHWYLDVLVVHPSHQQRGLGRAVLSPGLARADRDAVGCYLETGKTANLGIYRARGFEVTVESDVAAGDGRAGDDLHLWGMWRPSARAAADG